VNTWHIIATDRIEEIVLESGEQTEAWFKQRAIGISQLCPQAVIVVRDYDENDRWAFEDGMEVDL